MIWYYVCYRFYEKPRIFLFQIWRMPLCNMGNIAHSGLDRWLPSGFFKVAGKYFDEHGGGGLFISCENHRNKWWIFSCFVWGHRRVARGNHVKNFFPSVAYFRSNMYNDMPNMVNHWLWREKHGHTAKTTSIHAHVMVKTMVPATFRRERNQSIGQPVNCKNHNDRHFSKPPLLMNGLNLRSERRWNTICWTSQFEAHDWVGWWIGLPIILRTYNPRYIKGRVV